MLVQPHSKIILRDGIKSDTEFLSKSNIMDYSYVLFYLFSMKFFVHGLFPPPFFILSLLLGVDEDKKQIACGLVDTIGMFITTKKLFFL